MSSSTGVKSRRKVHGEKNRKGRLSEKASSFHGRSSPEDVIGKLTRPRTVPDLLSGRSAAGFSAAELRQPKLTKLLLNVTIQRTLGPVQVLISPESTVGDLIAAALRQYSKECRRPVFPSLDPSCFDLHYSQFSLESLKTEEKLIDLGSRNFFLCQRKTAADETTGEFIVPPLASSSCSKEAGKATKSGMGWLKFMDFKL